MVAKALLPIFGGTPAVWTVCMLFFQIALLVSYGYVWLLSSFKKPVVWRSIHLLFVGLSLLTLPILFHPTISDASPEWDILVNLVRQLGPPLFIIAASAPLLQFAYSQTNKKGAQDPYFLYIASNLGSLLSLLSYPWFIERYLGLSFQFRWWSTGYMVYLGLLLLVLLTNTYQPIEEVQEQVEAVPWRTRLVWIFLSFIPCSLMLGVTLYITTDVAPTPLFWVLPLALYLLTFVLTFTTKSVISHGWIVRNCLFFLIFTVIGFSLGVSQMRAWQIVLFNLLSFYTLALLCHGELFLRRPKAQHLTLFYFCLALGGVLAGIFNGIIAPHVFNQIYEYPLAILLSLLVLPKAKSTRGWWVPLIVLGLLLGQYYLPTVHWPKGYTSVQVITLITLVLVAIWQKNRLSVFLSLLILFAFIFVPTLKHQHILFQDRNFYGVKQVLDRNGVHALVSQSTVHGLQPMNEQKPISGYRSYYGAIKPVIEQMQILHPNMAVTIMGLGAGTMVCQHRSSDQLKVIEIDQQVIDLAKNPELFTFLRDCPAQVEIIKQDGRLAVENLKNNSQDMMVLDAFNSDAIPVHLMTLEAFRLYKQKMTDKGVLLVNLSNRYINLLPVVNAIGRSLDLMVFYEHHEGDTKLGQLNSEWVLLTTDQDLGFRLMKGNHWKFIENYKQYLWTDEQSNIIPLLKW